MIPRYCPTSNELVNLNKDLILFSLFGNSALTPSANMSMQTDQKVVLVTGYARQLLRATSALIRALLGGCDEIFRLTESNDQQVLTWRYRQRSLQGIPCTRYVVFAGARLSWTCPETPSMPLQGCARCGAEARDMNHSSLGRSRLFCAPRAIGAFSALLEAGMQDRWEWCSPQS